MSIDRIALSCVHPAVVAIVILLLLPISVLLMECLAALLPSPPFVRNSTLAIRTAILIPAHNEAAGIRATLECLLPQLTDRDRLIVIADNCTDNTAAIARAAGATVIERWDTTRRGKGYALDYGVRFLDADPPDVVVIVDADCDVAAGTLERIAQQAFTTKRPTQAVYLMERPTRPKPKDAVSAFAFTVKNLVRPRGLERLGFPCLLDGTGMAFPWSVIQTAALASGNIVEDMQLGIDLAIAGHPPLLCTDARVLGRLPQQEHAAKSQRTRWEHGHLQTLLTQVPTLFKTAIQQRRFDLLTMALDLAIPPLSLLVMLWLAVLLLTLCTGAVTGFWLAGWIAAAEGSLLLLAILIAWVRFGRADLPAQTLLAVPFYILWKVPLYLAFLVQPQTKWVRTDRDIVDS